MTFAQAVAVLVGLGVPFLVEILTKSTAPRWLKAGLAFALSTLGGVLTTVHYVPGSSWTRYVVVVAEAWVIAIATHYSGATQLAQDKTANFGLGGIRELSGSPFGMRIVVVNLTSAAKVLDADVKRWTAAVAAQAHDFAHEWGLAVPSVTFHAGKTPPAGDVAHTVVAIFDNSDQAGALGYHDETAGGVTYGRVFALDCAKDGISISSCLSHEVLEALADADVDRWVQAPDGRLWALEVADPVESSTYTVDGVELSDYVLPSFFDAAGRAPFSKNGVARAPFELASGGYAIVMSGGKVSQIFGDHYGRKAFARRTKASPLSRTARRLAAGRSRRAA